MDLQQLQTEITALVRRDYPEAKRAADEHGKSLTAPLARRVDASVNVSRDQLVELVVFMLLPRIEGEEGGSRECGRVAMTATEKGRIGP